MRHILKLGNLRAVERLAGKFGLVFRPPPPSEIFNCLREMKGVVKGILCPICLGAGCQGATGSATVLQAPLGTSNSWPQAGAVPEGRV